jgi:hypothetical protein
VKPRRCILSASRLTGWDQKVNGLVTTVESLYGSIEGMVPDCLGLKSQTDYKDAAGDPRGRRDDRRSGLGTALVVEINQAFRYTY